MPDKQGDSHDHSSRSAAVHAGRAAAPRTEDVQPAAAHTDERRRAPSLRGSLSLPTLVAAEDGPAGAGQPLRFNPPPQPATPCISTPLSDQVVRRIAHWALGAAPGGR
ncbi:MAG: hypothetical protein MO853_01350 [Candidatus Protistobacter heckmanni]|nr:hypothetical protein [Candidatus Protistobacter heckmanni]